jgi:hypothetical protein
MFDLNIDQDTNEEFLIEQQELETIELFTIYDN